MTENFILVKLLLFCWSLSASQEFEVSAVRVECLIQSSKNSSVYYAVLGFNINVCMTLKHFTTCRYRYRYRYTYVLSFNNQMPSRNFYFCTPCLKNNYISQEFFVYFVAFVVGLIMLSRLLNSF